MVIVLAQAAFAAAAALMTFAVVVRRDGYRTLGVILAAAAGFVAADGAVIMAASR